MAQAIDEVYETVPVGNRNVAVDDFDVWRLLGCHRGYQEVRKALTRLVEAGAVCCTIEITSERVRHWFWREAAQ